MTSRINVAFLGQSDQVPDVIVNVPGRGIGNRLDKYETLGVRSFIDGAQPSPYPDLEDGYRVQCFTDAALPSAHAGRFVEVTSWASD